MKNILKLIALGILGFILLIVLFVAVVFRATEGPAEVVREFFDEIAAGNYEQAYDLTSDIFQEKTPLSAVQEFAENEPVMLSYDRTTLNSRSIENSSATVAGQIIGIEGSINIESSLTKVGGEWLIDSVSFSYPELEDINLDDLELSEEELAELEALLAE